MPYFLYTHSCFVCDVYRAEYNESDKKFPEYCSECKTDEMIKTQKIWVEYMPLRPAYAITVHKAQGATLDYVDIQLDKDSMFDFGMAYVALSRGRELKNIKINFVDKDAFKVNPLVKQFYTENNLLPQSL